MFASMLKVELNKLYRRTLLWIELGALAGVIVLVFGGAFVARITGLFPNDAIDALITWPQSLDYSLTFVTGQAFGALIVMLLASVGVAQEYRWGTYGLWLRQGASRTIILAAKFIAMFGAIVVLTLTALLTGGLLSAVFTLILQGGLNVGQVNLLQMAAKVLLTVYSLLPYLSMSFLVAVLTRSTAWSLGVGAAYALVIEGPLTQILMFAIGGLPAKIAMWLPGPMALAIVDINNTLATVSTTEVVGGPQYLPPEAAAMGIAAYTLVFLSLAFWNFVRKDIPG
jgi:ABC-type transport system involved in multi-copper enzyme maturation permease subunit